VAHPLTGVGAAQFKNYNPAGRRERWRETHNVLIQVAAETGIFGLAAFCFLIVRAFTGARSTRRMLERAERGNPLPVDAVLSPDDRLALRAHTVGMTAALVGWLVCAMFSSVAYSWVFYYLLALVAAARELTRHRLAAAKVLAASTVGARAVPSARLPRRVAPGLA
jgi:O-antigen ligase